MRIDHTLIPRLTLAKRKHELVEVPEADLARALQHIDAERAFVPPGKPSGQKAAMAPVADMVRQAQARWRRDNIARVTVNNPGDAVPA